MTDSRVKYEYLPIEYRNMAQLIDLRAYMRGEINLRQLRALEYGLYEYTLPERIAFAIWEPIVAFISKFKRTKP